MSYLKVSLKEGGQVQETIAPSSDYDRCAATASFLPSLERDSSHFLTWRRLAFVSDPKKADHFFIYCDKIALL